MENYKIRVTKDYLCFCAAHFIVFRGDECEKIHGHNYRVAAELDAELGEDFLVFDFIEMKRILRAITDKLDHLMLVPTKSTKLAVEIGEKTVRIGFEDKEWIFPREDCALLPVENTTAELLARHIGQRLQEELEKGGAHLDRAGGFRALRIEVEETPGQSAVYEATATET